MTEMCWMLMDIPSFSIGFRMMIAARPGCGEIERQGRQTFQLFQIQGLVDAWGVPVSCAQHRDRNACAIEDICIAPSCRRFRYERDPQFSHAVRTAWIGGSVSASA